ncbi:MAG: hypothetical protein KDK99_10560, partial [Verrucomicrobiales bacterium]|nr:hypothetical protein [Verrucomicrobiales bacterium]
MSFSEMSVQTQMDNLKIPIQLDAPPERCGNCLKPGFQGGIKVDVEAGLPNGTLGQPFRRRHGQGSAGELSQPSDGFRQRIPRVEKIAGGMQQPTRRDPERTGNGC